MDKTLEAVARAIMCSRDNGLCYVKDWEAEQHDNPHVAQAVKQARAAIEAYEAAQWQPIETAPAHRPLILFFPRQNGRNSLPEMVKVDSLPLPYPRKPSHYFDVPPTPRSEGE